MTTYVQLKAFHAVAIERNFHRAADRLRLTQPAISIQIRNLERDSAVTLFRRSGHTISLTEAGYKLFKRTSRMFEAEVRALDLLGDREKDFSQTVHLGADGPHAALDLISEVRVTHPEIKFRVTMANAKTTWENLLSLKIDAAVMVKAHTDERAVTCEISSQSLVALIPIDHPLATLKSISFKKLSANSLIFRESGSSTQKIVDDGFGKYQQYVTPDLVLGSREAVTEAVARGLGIGFVYSREIGLDRRYVGVPISGLNHRNTDILAALKEQVKNPLVGKLFEVARKLATEKEVESFER